MSDPAISEKGIKQILDAAAELLMQAPMLVEGNPYYAIGALSIALGTAAAMAGTPYPELIEMLSRHYEQQLLREIGDSLDVSETLLPKKVGTN